MRLFLFITALFFMHSGISQYRHDPHEILYDSSSIQARPFSPEKMQSYKEDQDFQYDRYKEPPKSLWERFWEWFWNKIDEMLSTEGGSITFKTVLTLLAVVVIVFFIYKLTGMNRGSLFKRNTGDVSGYAVSDENIHSINFEQAIAQAIQDNDYRLAVRLLYLQSLKILADKNLINWQLNKTNIAYVDELQGSAYQPSFSNLTLQFESNWYGDMPIDATAFNTVHEQFNQFNRQL